MKTTDKRFRGYGSAHPRPVFLPRETVLHGSTDLLALGKAVMANDLTALALLSCDVARSLPAITAPLDAIGGDPMRRGRRGLSSKAGDRGSERDRTARPVARSHDVRGPLCPQSSGRDRGH